MKSNHVIKAAIIGDAPHVGFSVLTAAVLQVLVSGSAMAKVQPRYKTHDDGTHNSWVCDADKANNLACVEGSIADGGHAIAIGNGASATKVDSIVVGAGTSYAQRGIAIGKGAYIEDMGSHSAEGIAIGTGAKALDGTARRSIPNGVSGIAIGNHTFANQSTVDIGAKNRPAANGKTGNEAHGANRRGVTSIGADSYAAAHFSTIAGSYSAIKTNEDAQFKTEFFGFKFPTGVHSQGFGSTINGSLNTIIADIDPNTDDTADYDGIANAITGTANVIEHSNGALIMGAGNKISNSRKELVLNSVPTFANITDPNKLNEILNKRDAEGKKPELGSVGVFGGGNEVDHAYYSNIQGVDNALKGTDDAASEFVSIEGYRNQAENVEHLVTSGSFNKVTNGKENIVMGNYNELTGDNINRSQVKRNVILGFQDKGKNLIGKNISNNQIIGSNVTVAEGTTKGVLLGDDATVEGNGAVALGAESVAKRAALTVTDKSAAVSDASSASNQVYALKIATNDDKQAIVDTVKGDLASVSVGSADKTRQITNVAAGSDDTDAVNVAQLKAVANLLGKSSSIGRYEPQPEVSAGDNIQVQKFSGAHGQPVYQIATTDDLNVDSVKAGDTLINGDGMTINDGPSVTKTGIDGGGLKVTNVGNGDISAGSSDVVNGGQLFKIAGDLEQVIAGAEERASAGVASAMATAGLPQAYLPGKSMFSAAVGHYRGESAIAVGISTISDNGKWIIKGTASANKKDAGVTVGVGYQW